MKQRQYCAPINAYDHKECPHKRVRESIDDRVGKMLTADAPTFRIIDGWWEKTYDPSTSSVSCR